MYLNITNIKMKNGEIDVKIIRYLKIYFNRFLKRRYILNRKILFILF